MILLVSTHAVAAVFTLANKLKPAIIFIDEVDSLLGQRRSLENASLTSMKTQFMTLWDGFTTDSTFSIKFSTRKLFLVFDHCVITFHLFLSFSFIVAQCCHFPDVLYS